MQWKSLETVNLILGFQNLLFAVMYWPFMGSNYHRLLIIIPATASFFMHLSERKHDLPGISPFNRHAKLSLNIDRAFAAVGIGYYLFYMTHHTLSFEWYFDIIVALVFLGLSELVKPRKWFSIDNTAIHFESLWHLVTHTVWHFQAYKLIYIILSA